MSEPRATILLVVDDPALRAHYAAVLEREPTFRIEVAVDAEAALALLPRLYPDCVVSDLRVRGTDGFALGRQIKRDPALAHTMVLIVTGADDLQPRNEGLELGVDDYVIKPVEPAELVGRVRALVRARGQHAQIHAEKLKIETLHGALGRSFDQLLSLVVYMIDLRRPGAAARGARLAEAALKLAARFEVPPELQRDLELAAQLHEIGLAIDPLSRTASSAWFAQEQWRSLVVAKEALEQVQRLKVVAELVGCIAENWDGSGFPERWQRGQIPLRSRLLRLLIDFFAATERTSGPRLTPEAALEALQMHNGTWYDPMAVVHLETMVKATPELGTAAQTMRVPVEALEEGMVLAEDLCTSSGVKLLSAGASISRGSLDMIRRRDVGDPIIHGAVVRAAVA